MMGFTKAAQSKCSQPGSRRALSSTTGSYANPRPNRLRGARELHVRVVGGLPCAVVTKKTGAPTEAAGACVERIAPREPENPLDLPLVALVEQKLERLLQQPLLPLQPRVQRGMALWLRRSPADFRDPHRLLSIAVLPHDLSRSLYELVQGLYVRRVRVERRRIERSLDALRAVELLEELPRWQGAPRCAVAH